MRVKLVSDSPNVYRKHHRVSVLTYLFGVVDQHMCHYYSNNQVNIYPFHGKNRDLIVDIYHLVIRRKDHCMAGPIYP